MITVYGPKDTGDDSWSVSENRLWLPGVFESEEAARFAPRLPYEVIQRLQELTHLAHADGKGGPNITMELLRAAKAGTVALDQCPETNPEDLSGHRFRCIRAPHGPEVDHWTPAIFDEDHQNRWR